MDKDEIIIALFVGGFCLFLGGAVTACSVQEDCRAFGAHRFVLGTAIKCEPLKKD